MSSNNWSRYDSKGSPEDRDYKKSRDDKYSDENRTSKRDWKRSSRSPSLDSYKPKRTSDWDKEKGRDFDRENRDYGDSRSKWKSENFAGSSLGPVDWSKYQLSPFKKNFYIEHQAVKDRSEKDIEKFRSENRITIRSSWAPTPIFSFDELTLPKSITECIQRAGYLKPTPIQCQGWPAALSGHDVIGIAQTGSGKTASFLIPGIVHINAQAPLSSGDGPVALVLAPTRELSMQIAAECEKFTRNGNVRSVCVYGGAEKYPQQRELQRGAHIVIACPGRLLDFLESNVVNLRRVTYLVLDEADRMLDMGFEPQIRKILSQIRPDRQTLMWSATWPREVQKLALDLCREKPIHIVIGDSDLTVNSCIKQNIEVLEENMKESRMIKLLENITDGSKILIFCQTKRGCDRLADALKREKYQAISIHGDKSQNQRDYIMKTFKTGRSSILVATDLAARGLDVSDIYYVVNYDFPMQLEDYIHRVGRTGRAGRKGISYTFFTRGNYKYASGLIDILEETGQKVPNELYKMARRPIPLNNVSKNSYEDEKPKTNYYSNTSYSNGNINPSRDSFSGSKSRFEFTSAPPSNNSYNYKPYTPPPSYQLPQYQYPSYSSTNGTTVNQQNSGNEINSSSMPPSNQNGVSNGITQSVSNGMSNGVNNSSNNGVNNVNGVVNGNGVQKESGTSNSNTISNGTMNNTNKNAYDMMKFFNYNLMFPPPMMPSTNGTTQSPYGSQNYPNPMAWYYLNQLQNTSAQMNQNTQNLGVGGNPEKPAEVEKKTH